MKKYKWASIGVFILALMCIVALHSYFNLKERINPPSQMWGRDNPIGVTTFNKEPIAAYDGTEVNVIFAQDQGFKHAIIDNNGVIKSISGFNIKGYRPDKLMSYQGNSKFMLLLEDYNLYYAESEAGKATCERQKLLSGIQGFTFLDAGESSYIAAYDKNTMSVYKLEDGMLSKFSEPLQVKNIRYVNLKKSENDIFHLAYINEPSALEYNLMYQSFDPVANQWTPRMKPYMIENLSSYNLNNLQMCFDDEDMYLFYELYKTSPKGMVAQTYMGRIPQGSASANELTFAILNLDNEKFVGDSYITSLKCIDEKSDVIRTIMATPVKSSPKREGNELMYAVIDKGKVVEKYLASNTGQWNSDVMINKCGSQYFAFFMQTMGKSQYEIRMTSSGEEYRQMADRIHKADVWDSVRDTFSGYFLALVLVFVGFLIIVPSLLWPIAVDFFEWKRFYYNEDLTFKVGAALEAVFMFINMKMIYANPTTVGYLPDLLKFPGAKYVYLIITFAVAYLVASLFRKSKKELHMFPQLLVLTMAHLILVYFLYAKYIAGF